MELAAYKITFADAYEFYRLFGAVVCLGKGDFGLTENLKYVSSQQFEFILL